MIKAILILISILIFSGCSPTEKISFDIQEGIALTQTISYTEIPTPTQTDRPTIPPIETSTQTTIPTSTDTPRPSPTLPQTSTPSPKPTLSPTPSQTGKPTSTPILPNLASLVPSEQEILNIETRWQTPIHRTRLYKENPEICRIDCISLRFESHDAKTTLSWIIYRLESPQNAVYAAFGIKDLYLEKEGFSEIVFPVDIYVELSPFSWASSKEDLEFIFLVRKAQQYFLYTFKALSHKTLMKFLIFLANMHYSNSKNWRMGGI